MEENPTSARLAIKYLLRFSMFFAVCLIGFVAFLPSIIANTSLRDSLISRAIDDPDLEASVGSASFGWFSPISLNQMDIVRNDQTLKIDVQRLEVKRPLLNLLFSLPAIGTIEIDRPVTNLVLTERLIDELEDVGNEGPRSGNRSGSSGSTLTAIVRDGTIVVRTADSPEPIIDLSDLSVTVRVRDSHAGRELVIDPVVVFDHQNLTPDLCDRGLQLVAPVLAEAANVEGEISVELKEFHVPVGQQNNPHRNEVLKISGNVQLHEVRSSLKNPILVEISKLVSHLLGKNSPETIRILDNTQIDFAVQEDRIYHEGLAFVLPEISEELVIRTSGTVGVDESLDLAVNVTLPANASADIPFLRKLTAEPLVFRLTGTMENPKLHFPQGRDLLGEVTNRLLPAERKNEENSLPGAITNLVDGFSKKTDDGKTDLESTAGNILNLIQAIQNEDKRKKQTEKNPAP